MKLLKPLLPTLAVVIFAVGVSHADLFYKWSTTAANNANSDTFTWAEGQAPSTVNDSARGMMAALAKYRDDTSGKLVTTGTATAYVLASNQGFTSLALMDGAGLTFRVNATSGAAPTLNVDGLGAKALNQATGIAVATGALISGAIYSATYVNASNEWIVQGTAGVMPSGTTMLSMTACPVGWTLSATNTDRTLIISSTTAGTTGGTVSYTTAFSGSGVVGSHALTAAELALHTHGFSGTTGNTNQSLDHTHQILQTVGSATSAAAAGNTYAGPATPTATGTSSIGVGTHDHNFSGSTDTGAGVVGSAHNHTIPAVQYVTAIACTKN